jgi:hypothetical protein
MKDENFLLFVGYSFNMSDKFKKSLSLLYNISIFQIENQVTMKIEKLIEDDFKAIDGFFFK